jgi:hypothetical protein
MTLNQLRYSLAVVARELPADMDEQTAEYAAIALISRIRRRFARAALVRFCRDNRHNTAVGESMRERAAADRAAAAHSRELARRAAERAADRASLAAWAGELARHAAGECQTAQRSAARFGMLLARMRPAPGELAPVHVTRVAAATADVAERAARRCELARRFACAV